VEIRHAYDLNVLHAEFEARDPTHDGWIFGRPRGIEPRHWPIDRISGYPLMHGFTLRLPEEYRIHGPELAGLAFFSVDPEHNDGAPVPGLDVRELLERHPGEPPADGELAAIWRHARAEHPRLHRMHDILGSEYAVFLLTEDELVGARCEPPDWVRSRALRRAPVPSWLVRGEGRSKAFSYMADVLGGDPDLDPGFERAIRCTRRSNDPNAGVAPREPSFGAGDYVSPYDDETGELHAWAAAFGPNHIGGTMRPWQAVPEMSPAYIGFEEWFGGYNFGLGNAQLDFRAMALDWAC